MVHVEKVPGQKGYMVIQEDGTILSSTGELSSNELTSNQITSLMSHSLPVDFNTSSSPTAGLNGDVNGSGEAGGHLNVSFSPGGSSNGGSGDVARGFKWNRITVQFKDESYVACLSNRRIHVVKRDNAESAATSQQ
ncbi:unnamed protein product [Allacma fusca]|uniref:Late endosomal/lysosomal adaptor and MAPK and MTOR activator 4 n=1 Tax=Allacma fusca TaxID=39272 RepID=A0A8J2KCX4_9HEXA|nr:unnamed protein product [Allacma fusca]